MNKLAFLDLINTEHIHSADRVTDSLDDPKARRRLMQRWQTGSQDWTEVEIEMLRRLRATLRSAIAEIMRNGAPSAAHLALLNGFLAKGFSRTQMMATDRGGFELIETWSDPTILVAATFARYLATDDAKRLKLCANCHCRWAFEDQSKNRSRLWCSSEACGNVAKVRAYRNRRRSLG